MPALWRSKPMNGIYTAGLRKPGHYCRLRTHHRAEGRDEALVLLARERRAAMRGAASCVNDTLVLIPILALAQASSPLFGKPPFYGCTWVFYADLVAGVLAGLLGARLRARGSAASLSITWYIAGGLFGGVAGGAGVLPFYLMNALVIGRLCAP